MIAAAALPTRFKPYPAYTDSGIEWLGEIPAHWEVKKLTWLTECLDGSRVPLNAEERGRMQGDYPYWGANSIVDYVDKWLFDQELVLLGEDGAPFFDRTKAVAFRVSGRIWVNNHTHVLRPRRTIEGAFLAHALNCVDYRAFIDGTTRDKLTQGDMNGIPIQCPRINEQRAIAAFLDRETARLDALVTKKQRLIELLQEQRTALITQAVTRGLDPNVPLKDSGVEWLGEIPAHWEVVPSTWLFTESKQRALDADEQLSATQKYGVIAQAEFERLEGRQVVHAFMHLDQRKHVEVDDFVMSMRSFEGGLERVRVRGCVRSSYGILRASPNVHIGFFSHLFKSSAYIQALRATSNFIRDGQDLNFQNFRLAKLPSVPMREQEAIAAFLDRETARIDALVAKVREAIERLKELRTALISAAVTGKIDVREEAA